MILRMGTSELGGTFYTQGSAIAELFNRGRAEGDRCVVQTSAASIHNAEMLDKGELEFGFMASNWIGLARGGSAPFTRKIALSMICPVNAGPLFFVTLAGSPIQTHADFKGRRIAVGAKGSGMEQHVRTIFGVLEIPLRSVTPIYMGFAEGAEALMAGEIDVQFQPPIPNRVMANLSERAEIRVVSYAPGQLKKILAQVPFYRPVTMEAGVFRGVIEDTAQLAVINVLVTHEHVPEPAVEAMARAIADNLEILPQMNPLFNGLEHLFEPLRVKGTAAFEFGDVPLHGGAIRAYEKANWLR